MLRRDELAMLLCGLAVGEEAAQRADAAADPSAPLVARRALLTLRPQLVRTAQAGRPATDDRDPLLARGADRAGCGRSQAAARSQGRGGGTRLEQRAAADAPSGVGTSGART